MGRELKIGQFRKSGLSNESYTTVLEKSIDYKTEYIENKLHPNARDYAIIFTQPKTNENVYHIKGKIKRIRNQNQKITVYVEDNQSTTGDIQNIKYIFISSGDSGDLWVSFDIIFQSLQTFNQIVFDLERGGKYAELNVKAEIDEISIMNNILPLIKQEEPILKLGIQGTPGQLMAINGEEIHIGKTGIYEIYYEDIKITSVAFDIRKRDKISNKDPDYFIMDYQYE